MLDSIDHGPGTGTADPRRWRLLAFVALAQFIVLLDTTVVNLALPVIQRDTGSSATTVEWVLTGYVLTFGGMMLLGGRIADRWGRRRTFFLGTVVFTGASLACGLSPDAGALIVGRVVQGCGAALLSPSAMSLVTTTFPAGRERNTALAVWAALAGLGATLGVVVGGLVTESLSWRWIFHINVPVGLLAVAGVAVLTDPQAPRTSGNRPDVLGALTVTGGMTGLVYAIVKAQSDGWHATAVLLPGACAVVLLAAFALVEHRASDPLVPFALLRTRSLLTSVIARILTSAVQVAVLFLSSYFLQRSLGYGPLEAGFAFLPIGIAAIVSTAPATRLLHRSGPRPVYLAGSLGSLAALVWLARVPPDASYALGLLPSFVLLGAAMQWCTIPVNIHGLSEIPEHRQGLVSAMLTSAFQVGASLGLATIATRAVARAEEAVHAGSGAGTPWAEGAHVGFWLAAVVAVANLLNAWAGFEKRPLPSAVRTD